MENYSSRLPWHSREMFQDSGKTHAFLREVFGGKCWTYIGRYCCTIISSITVVCHLTELIADAFGLVDAKQMEDLS